MVEIRDINLLNQKLSIIKSTFKLADNRNKLLYITDFDYTITRKYNDSTNGKFLNTYNIYNQDAFGGDQTLYLSQDKKLAELYGKYEEDTSYDYEIRKEKSFKWYELSLLNMSNNQIKPESFKKMVELSKEHIKFRKDIKILLEILIKKDIPILIISGGIKEIIIEILKKLKIEGFDNYLKQKRLIIIANSLLDENGKLINWNDKEKKDDIIYPFNKNIIIKKNLQKYFNGFESIIIVGDLISDYKSIEEIEINKKQNVIGFGFLDYNLSKISSDFNYKNDGMFKEYANIFDVVLINDQGYEYIINIVKKIISE